MDWLKYNYLLELFSKLLDNTISVFPRFGELFSVYTSKMRRNDKQSVMNLQIRSMT